MGAHLQGCAVPGPHATLALRPWLAEINEVICASLAPSMQRGYSRKVKEFEDFKQVAGLPSQWPALAEHLLLSLLHLKRSGRAG